jgi:hypothetical protein
MDIILKTRGPKLKTHCKNGHEFVEGSYKQLFHKNGTKNGRKCMECNRINHRRYYQKDIPERCARAKRYRESNPETVKNTILKRKFGITLEQYKEMLLSQDNKCALCGTSEPGRGNLYFQVDHCHKTMRIRKLLCTTCNVALGAAYDDPNLLEKMAAYIRSYQ